MKPIYAQMGFNEQSLALTLAEIKRLHDLSLAEPDYMVKVRRNRKAVADMVKAADKLGCALSNLPDHVKASMQAAPAQFTDYLALLKQGMPVNIGNSPGQPLPTQATIIKGRFIRNVAIAYTGQTGNKPGISVSSKGKSGQFIEFLLAVVDELGINTPGLVRRAQALVEKKRI